MNLCPFCYTENPDSAFYCSGCGSALVEGAPQPKAAAPGEAAPAPVSKRQKTKVREAPVVKAGTLVSAGQVLGGRYELLSLAGNGTYASVWKARDSHDGRSVAVKVLEFLPYNDEDAAVLRQRFEQEGAVCQQLLHEHVVQVLDVGQHEGAAFFVMEWVKGRSLKEVLQEKGRLEAPLAVDYARQLAGALAFAHGYGILHRDLKPANILVDEENEEVKLGDFGIARVIDESSQGSRLTRPGTLLGTVEYMAPEYIETAQASPSCDLYALGVVLYEMLTGAPPFHSKKPMEVLKMQMKGKPVPPSEAAPDADIPPYLDALVMRCLEKKPADRFESLEDFTKHLDRTGEKKDEEQENLVGTTLRDYEIEALLGKGGMAAVYKARHTRLGSYRAIKVIHKDLAQQPNFYERFRVEAQIAEKLSHPNLAVLHDFSQTDGGLVYAVWEYVEGRTVAERLLDMRGEPLPIKEAVEIARQAASGLAHAHARGIIHRDIAPDNLILQKGEEGLRVKVIDFGIAKSASGLARGRTGTQSFLGKVGYSSPEQMGNLAEGETIDPRADVFSLGAVLYEMLAGIPLFPAESFFDYMRQLTAFEPGDADFPAAVPQPLRKVVLKAVNPEREKRFSSMSEFLAALQEAAAPPAKPKAAVPPPPPPRAAAPPPPRAAAAPPPRPAPPAAASSSGTVTTVRAKMETPLPVTKRSAFTPPEPEEWQVLSLEHISLPSLIANLYRTGACGVLSVSFDRRRLDLYVQDGMVVNVGGDQGGGYIREFKDLVAALQFARADSGRGVSFGSLQPDAVPRDFRIPLPLLALASCQPEDVQPMRSVMQKIQARPRFRMPLKELSALMTLSSAEAFTLSQVSGGSSFSELFSASPLPPQDALRLLACLSWLGVITVGENNPPWLDVDLLEYSLDQEQVRSSEGEAERQKILSFCEKVRAAVNPSEVLGVPQIPHLEQVKEAHERLLKDYDPQNFSEAGRKAMRHELSVIRMRLDEAAFLLMSRKDISRERREGDELDLTSEKYQKRLGGLKSGKEMEVENLKKQALALLRQAQAAYEKKDYWAAIQSAESGVAMDPNNAEMHAILGMAQAKNPKWGKKAIESLEQAVKLDPMSQKASLALAEVLIERGLKTKARAELQRILDVHPDLTAAKNMLRALGK